MGPRGRKQGREVWHSPRCVRVGVRDEPRCIHGSKSGYRPRRPERSVLYQVGHQHMQRLFAEAEPMVAALRSSAQPARLCSLPSVRSSAIMSSIL